MLAVQLAKVTETPPGVAEALSVIDGFDAALTAGLGRPNDSTEAALEQLAAAVNATPLADAVRAAVDKTLSGSLHEEHMAALAGARAAVWGAIHDCLLGSLDQALGRSRGEWPARPAAPQPELPFAAARSWLRDAAIAGWRGVDEDVLAGTDQTIRSALDAPAGRRLATVLDGLVGELRACIPMAGLPQIPTRRWADLWTRAVLLAQPGHPAHDPAVGATVSGRLFVLGIDIREHGTAAQVQVHAILEETGQTPRLVRTSVAVAKVESIVGAAIWPLLQRYPLLMRALAEQRAIEVTGIALHDSGDLSWSEERATLSEPADPFATARVLLPTAAAAAVPPLDRHPVQIAEPVLLEGYTVDDGALVLGGHRLPLAADRIPAAGPLTVEHVAASAACLGLLRWEQDGWRLQPIGVTATVKKKPVAVHVSDWATGPTDPKVAKAAGDGVAVLKERAGRLLRR